MKKYLVLIVTMCLILTGCGTYKLEDAVNDFTKSVESSKSYKLNGTMEISSGEELFIYNIDAYFLKDDFYKVVLVNQTNNHEQVILKNKEGLYVVTPSLNNNEDIIKIKVTFKSVNLKAKLKEDDFVLEDLIDTKAEDSNKDSSNNTTDTNKDSKNNTDNKETKKNESCSGTNCKDNKTCEGKECDKTTSSLDSIIYPLYIPTNTHLKSSETVSTTDGERVILTFSGDKNFVIVEETSKFSDEFEVIPVFGDPLMLDKTIAALSSNSISWNAENVSYYLVSSDLSSNEMVNVAKSLGNSKTVISTK